MLADGNDLHEEGKGDDGTAGKHVAGSPPHHENWRESPDDSQAVKQARRMVNLLTQARCGSFSSVSCHCRTMRGQGMTNGKLLSNLAGS